MFIIQIVFFRIPSPQTDSLGAKLLWVNPNPNENFIPQTIHIDISSYKFLILFFNYALGSNRFSSQMAMTNLDDKEQYLSSVDGWKVRSRKIISTYNNEIVFGIGRSSSFNNAGGDTEDNGAIIPYEIYGLK